MFSGFPSDYVYPHHIILNYHPNFTLCVDRGVFQSFMYTRNAIFHDKGGNLFLVFVSDDQIYSVHSIYQQGLAHVPL